MDRYNNITTEKIFDMEREENILTGSDQVCWFDERVGDLAVGETGFDVSHNEAVFAFRFSVQ